MNELHNELTRAQLLLAGSHEAALFKKKKVRSGVSLSTVPGSCMMHWPPVLGSLSYSEFIIIFVY
jgi:hypothetical protein